MSLINEALKKAQRQRNEAAAAGANPADGPVAKRAEPKSAKSMVLIGVGVLVLVVISIAATALWISRPISHPTATVTKAPVAPTAQSGNAPQTAAPMLVVPAIKPPAESVTAQPARSKSESVAPAAGTGTQSATSLAAEATTAGTAATPAAAGPEAATSAAPAPEVKPAPAAPQPDDRIRQFVDNVRVTGVRSSGSDSKVLMNDRVYRVNQIVNADLGVRLTKVANDSLTFTDRNGVEYVKYF